MIISNNLSISIRDLEISDVRANENSKRYKSQLASLKEVILLCKSDGSLENNYSIHYEIQVASIEHMLYSNVILRGVHNRGNPKQDESQREGTNGTVPCSNDGVHGNESLITHESQTPDTRESIPCSNRENENVILDDSLRSAPKELKTSSYDDARENENLTGNKSLISAPNESMTCCDVKVKKFYIIIYDHNYLIYQPITVEFDVLLNQPRIFTQHTTLGGNITIEYKRTGKSTTNEKSIGFESSQNEDVHEPLCPSKNLDTVFTNLIKGLGEHAVKDDDSSCGYSVIYPGMFSFDDCTPSGNKCDNISEIDEIMGNLTVYLIALEFANQKGYSTVEIVDKSFGPKPRSRKPRVYQHYKDKNSDCMYYTPYNKSYEKLYNNDYSRMNSLDHASDCLINQTKPISRFIPRNKNPYTMMLAEKIQKMQSRYALLNRNKIFDVEIEKRNPQHDAISKQGAQPLTKPIPSTNLKSDDFQENRNSKHVEAHGVVTKAPTSCNNNVTSNDVKVNENSKHVEAHGVVTKSPTSCNINITSNDVKVNENSKQVEAHAIVTKAPTACNINVISNDVKVNENSNQVKAHGVVTKAPTACNINITSNDVKVNENSNQGESQISAPEETIPCCNLSSVSFTYIVQFPRKVVRMIYKGSMTGTKYMCKKIRIQTR